MGFRQKTSYYEKYKEFIDLFKNRLEGFTEEIKGQDKIGIHCVVDGHLEERRLDHIVDSFRLYNCSCGCTKCGFSVGRERQVRSMGPEGFREMRVHQMESMGYEALQEAGRKAAAKCKAEGTGLFSEESKKKSVEAWVDSGNKKFQGAMEPKLWSMGGKKVRFYDELTGDRYEIDCLFPEGHSVEEDDNSHKEGSRKPIGYHRKKDEAIYRYTGYYPLHIISPRFFNKDGPQARFDSFEELIESYRNDSLPKDFPLIDLTSSCYGRIEYEGIK